MTGSNPSLAKWQKQLLERLKKMQLRKEKLLLWRRRHGKTVLFSELQKKAKSPCTKK